MSILLRKKGFTLIELLVTIAIVSLLASIVLGNLQTARTKAQNVVAVQTLKQYELAFNTYAIDNGYYPYVRGGQVVKCLGEATVTCWLWGWDLPNDAAFIALLHPYLPTLPQVKTGVFNPANELSGAYYQCDTVIQLPGPAGCLNASLWFPQYGDTCTFGYLNRRYSGFVQCYYPLPTLSP
jgi:prepilin-type N-terminal cleavage/methylation domain-containing protein